MISFFLSMRITWNCDDADDDDDDKTNQIDAHKEKYNMEKSCARTVIVFKSLLILIFNFLIILMESRVTQWPINGNKSACKQTSIFFIYFTTYYLLIKSCMEVVN